MNVTWNLDGGHNVRRARSLQRFFALDKLLHGTLLGSKLIGELCVSVYIYYIEADVFAPMHIAHTRYSPTCDYYGLRISQDFFFILCGHTYVYMVLSLYVNQPNTHAHIIYSSDVNQSNSYTDYVQASLISLALAWLW